MTGMSEPVLSIVLPVYNEAESLPHLFPKLDRLEESLEDLAIEVILVDDHSTDDSPDLLRQACQTKPNRRYVRLSRNSGSHAAIYAGLEKARGSAAIFLASDLQDPPELISQLVTRWKAGNQIVWAVRQQREGLGPIEQLTIRLYYFILIQICGVTPPPQGSDFALLDRRALNALLEARGSQPSLGADIAALGFRQDEVLYRKLARKYGQSKWTLRRKLRAFMDVLVRFSYVPIRLMTTMGLLVSLGGFIYAALLTGLRIFGSGAAEGWTSIMVVVLMLGGVQMVMLGMLGEYLMRTLDESRRRPLYFIEAELEMDKEPVTHDEGIRE